MGLFDAFKKQDLHGTFTFECKNKVNSIKRELEGRYEDVNNYQYEQIKDSLAELTDIFDQRRTSAAAKSNTKKVEAKIMGLLDRLESASKNDNLAIQDYIEFVSTNIKGLYSVYNGAKKSNKILDDKIHDQILDKTLSVYERQMYSAIEIQALEEKIAKAKEMAHRPGITTLELNKIKSNILNWKASIQAKEKELNMESQALDQLLAKAEVISQGELAERLKENITIKDFQKRMYKNTKAMDKFYEALDEDNEIIGEFSKNSDEKVTAHNGVSYRQQQATKSVQSDIIADEEAALTGKSKEEALLDDIDNL